MSSSKKNSCKGTLRQVFICLSQETHTTCSHREGGRVEPERRLEGLRGATRNSSQSRVYNTNKTVCISSLLDDDILLWFLFSSLVHVFIYLLTWGLGGGGGGGGTPKNGNICVKIKKNKTQIFTGQKGVKKIKPNII